MDLQSLNIESLEQLKYTSCVIKETLRINPPVPGGFRVALRTFELNVSEQALLNIFLNGRLQSYISISTFVSLQVLFCWSFSFKKLLLLNGLTLL